MPPPGFRTKQPQRPSSADLKQRLHAFRYDVRYIYLRGLDELQEVH